MNAVEISRMTLEKWYGGYQIPDYHHSSYVPFLSSCVGIVNSIMKENINNQVRVVFGSVATGAANHEDSLIMLNKEYLSGKFTDEFKAVDSVDAISTILGIIVHEAAHFAYSPPTLATFADYVEKATTNTYHRNVAATLGNIVEDIYIEAEVARSTPALRWMIDHTNTNFQSDTFVTDILKSASNIKAAPKSYAQLSSAMSVCLIAKTRDEVNTTPWLEGLFDLALTARDAYTLEERQAITLELYEELMKGLVEEDEDSGEPELSVTLEQEGEEEQEEQEESSGNGQGQGLDQEQGEEESEKEESQGQEQGEEEGEEEKEEGEGASSSAGATLSEEGDDEGGEQEAATPKEPTKKTLDKLINPVTSKEQVIDDLTRQLSKASDITTLDIGVKVVDTLNSYDHTSRAFLKVVPAGVLQMEGIIVPDERYKELAQVARQRAMSIKPYGLNRTRGHNIRNLYRIGTDQKIFAEKVLIHDHKPMQVGILVDNSGSMINATHNRRGGRQTNLLEAALSAALGATKALMESRCNVGLFSHTADVCGLAGSIVYSVKDFGETANQIEEKLNWLARLADVGSNRDGTAIEYVASHMQNKNLRRLLIVISDGRPAANNYDGLRHTKEVVEKVRRQGIDVMSISITNDAKVSNNHIYGEENNVFDKDPNVIQNIVAKLIK